MAQILQLQTPTFTLVKRVRHEQDHWRKYRMANALALSYVACGLLSFASFWMIMENYNADY